MDFDKLSDTMDLEGEVEFARKQSEHPLRAFVFVEWGKAGMGVKPPKEKDRVIFPKDEGQLRLLGFRG